MLIFYFAYNVDLTIILLYIYIIDTIIMNVIKKKKKMTNSRAVVLYVEPIVNRMYSTAAEMFIILLYII